MSLEVKNVTAGYQKEIPVLRGVSIKADKAKVTVIIGPNGSGKSTLLKVIYGFIKPVKGNILYDGHDITGLEPSRMIAQGIAYLLQGRSVFSKMLVAENLQLGGWIMRNRSGAIREALEVQYNKYPVLKEKKNSKAGELSGGQQKVVEISRSMIAKPRTILLDEPTAGLAPKVAEEVYKEVNTLKKEGFTILLVDQNVRKAVSLADYVYVLELGKNEQEGPGEEFAANLDAVIKGWLLK